MQTPININKRISLPKNKEIITQDVPNAKINRKVEKLPKRFKQILPCKFSGYKISQTDEP